MLDDEYNKSLAEKRRIAAKKYRSLPLLEFITKVFVECGYDTKKLDNVFIDELITDYHNIWGCFKKGNKFVIYYTDERCHLFMDEYDDPYQFICQFIISANSHSDPVDERKALQKKKLRNGTGAEMPKCIWNGGIKMENKSSIEEQVAQLTEEEKDQILKAGKIATTIGLIIIGLMVLWMLLGVYLMFSPPVGVEMDYVKMAYGTIAGEVIGFAAILVMGLIVKVKYPFYSDKKYNYIKKLNKK